MGAAVRRGDIVGEGVHILGITVVVLHRHFHEDAVLHAFRVDRFREQHLLVLVQELHELAQAALEAEVMLLRGLTAFVPEYDAHALVQERHLPQAVPQGLILVLDAHLEDAFGIFIAFDIRPELDGRPGPFGGADHPQVVQVLSALVLLLVDLPVLVYRHLEMPAQRVHHRSAHAVQAAGYLVSPAAEFATGMQHRQAHFNGRSSHFRV